MNGFAYRSRRYKYPDERCGRIFAKPFFFFANTVNVAVRAIPRVEFIENDESVATTSDDSIEHGMTRNTFEW